MEPGRPVARAVIVREKRRYRRSVMTAVALLDPDERRTQEAALLEAFPRLDGWSSARTVLLYVSAFADEVGTAPLLSIAYDSGKAVVLPRVDRSERRLRLHVVRDPRRELAPGVLGILEPPASLPEAEPGSIDWGLIPGVAFDERGYRLGRGAGHYDRLLPSMRPDCICCAACLGCQLVPSLPIEPHDVPLDRVMAPDRLIRGIGRGITPGRHDQF